MERTSKGYVDYEDRIGAKTWKRPKRTVAPTANLDLLAEVIPAARNSDPPTSNDALHDLLPRAGSQQHRLLLAYGTRPLGLTAEEAAEIAYLNVVGCSYWKRVGELLKAGLIEDTFTEREASTGSMQRVCAISARGKQALAKRTP